MNSIIDEILYLYFQGFYFNDILNAIKNNQKQQNKTGNGKARNKKSPITKDQCIDLSMPGTKYPQSFTKLDVKEYEAIQFNKALAGRLDLVPGTTYQIIEPKGKKLKVCFIGKFKEESSRYVRLEHKHGYSETFLKSDLISGEYLIRRHKHGE